jgi:hypothetical protein
VSDPITDTARGSMVGALRVAAFSIGHPDEWVRIVSDAAQRSVPLADAVASWLNRLADEVMAGAEQTDATADPWGEAYDRNAATRDRPGWGPR